MCNVLNQISWSAATNVFSCFLPCKSAVVIDADYHVSEQLFFFLSAVSTFVVRVTLLIDLKKNKKRRVYSLQARLKVKLQDTMGRIPWQQYEDKGTECWRFLWARWICWPVSHGELAVVIIHVNSFFVLVSKQVASRLWSTHRAIGPYTRKSSSACKTLLSPLIIEALHALMM